MLNRSPSARSSRPSGRTPSGGLPGHQPKNYRLAAFVIAGAFAGLAGALFAPFQGNISPVAVHWTKSVDPLFMNLIGGVNHLAGPVVGSVVYMFFREWLSSLTEYWRIWFGSILVLIALALPLGLIGFFKAGLLQATHRTRKPALAHSLEE